MKRAPSFTDEALECRVPPSGTADRFKQLQFWAAVVDSSGDAIIVTTLDKNICGWNLAAESLFCYAKEEIVGRSITALTPEELHHQEDDIFAKLKRGERVEDLETVRINKQGAPLDVSITASPVRDDQDQTVCAYTMRDIRERKQAERVRAQLAAIVESSDDAIISKTLESIIQSWNAGANHLFGYTAEEAIGKSVLMLIPPELQYEEIMILDSIRRGERVHHFDTVRIAKDGRRVPVSLTVSPVRDEEGKIIGASKIARDVSVRKHAEEFLAQEADALGKLNRFSSLLWKSRDLSAGLNEILNAVVELMFADFGNIQLLDADGQVLRIVAQRGFDQPFLDYFSEVSTSDASACGRALRNGERVIIPDVEVDEEYTPLRAVARAAQYRAVISTPLINADGNLVGIISIHYRSPREFVLRELRLLDLYARQACDFIQRSQIEDRLRRNEERLKEADRRKDEFLALLAHELRNPLAPIRYALALVDKPAHSEEHVRYSKDVIARQVAHMSRLLDDLLDISRITRGKLNLQIAPTELTLIVGASIEAARPILDAKDHQLTIDLPTHPVRLDADQIRLTQVFSNLLINAAKYTDPGGHINLHAAIDGDEIEIRIVDDGIGITEEFFPNLFTIFSQGEGVLSRSEGGLGVGLSIVKGIAELHGGSVMAQSEGLNKGSTFIVRLPTVASAQCNASEREDTIAHSNHVARKILIVDDNRDAAMSCQMLLSLSGHEVHTAYTARQGLTLAEKYLPEIILLDIGLPDMTGYKLAEKIRATTWGKQMVLIAVTGWGQQEDKQLALASGFNQHLTKPVSTDLLDSLIASIDSQKL